MYDSMWELYVWENMYICRFIRIFGNCMYVKICMYVNIIRFKYNIYVNMYIYVGLWLYGNMYIYWFV